MTAPEPRIFLSAGEPSGDLHGAQVIRALKARVPGAQVEAFGGPRMAEAGATVRYRMEALGAFGVVKRHYRAVMRVGGGMLVTIGVLLVTGAWADLTIKMQSWVSGFKTVI